MSSMGHAMRKAGLHPRRSHGNRDRVPVPKPPKLPDTYFSTDSENRDYLEPAFVSRSSVNALARSLGEARPNLTTGQTRRFFNHCRAIERSLTIDGESWDRVAARFESLCYHAQNAQAARKIPVEFREFIDDNVRRVTSHPNAREAFLRGFLPHFEALIGFGTAYFKRES